jgi:hypothetical protein
MTVSRHRGGFRRITRKEEVGRIGGRGFPNVQFADDPLGTQLPHPRIWRFSSNDTGLLNFRFERVAANSFIQAARMYRGRDFQFGAR